ncbi:ribonuclease P protein component, partial [bacterium]|nr:ribonuclease P protein component [bacterium]
MLSKQHRLQSEEEIRAVLRRGVCASTAGVRICALPAADKEGRTAVVVGKKVDKRAVIRHRYQRWLRELVREQLSSSERLSQYDMVWLAQPSISKHTQLNALRAEVTDCVKGLTKRLSIT